MVICAALFAVRRANEEIDFALLFDLSIWATILSLLLFYLGTLYAHNIGPNAPSRIRADEDGFTSEFIKHRGGA